MIVLEKKSTDDFVILNLTDPQLSDEEWTAAPNTQKTGLGEPVEDAFGNYAYLSPRGDRYETVGSYPADEGMFSRIRQLGPTRTVIAGQDHVNNTLWAYRGVKLVYSLKTALAAIGGKA